MPKFNPIHLAAAVAIVLSGTAAMAQTAGGTLRVAPSGTATTTTGTTATPASPAASPATGGCTGTGGSSCTATTNSTPGSTTATTAATTPSPGVRSDSSANSLPTLLESPNQSAGGTGSGMGTNQTTVDPATTRPGSFEPGGAFGPPATNTQGTATVASTRNGTTGAVIIPGDTGNPSPQNVVIQQQPATQTEVRALATPLLDQTTREAQSRESRRRIAKQEPRIIGIAPNTDRDLTNQMPDDRIIRY